MKPKLLVLVFFIFCVSILCADVYQVSGNISTNTVWTAGDWYVLTGTVKVLDGANLYIEHGVKVLFNIDTSLEIEGSLTAVGLQAPTSLLNLLHIRCFQTDAIQTSYSMEQKAAL